MRLLCFFCGLSDVRQAGRTARDLLGGQRLRLGRGVQTLLCYGQHQFDAARSLGVELDEYFDDYVFEHRWA